MKSGGGSGLGAAGEALAAGILLPLCVVGGYLLGRWAGRAFGVPEALGYAGGALGAVAGFWNLFRLGNRGSSSGRGGE